MIDGNIKEDNELSRDIACHPSTRKEANEMFTSNEPYISCPGFSQECLISSIACDDLKLEWADEFRISGITRDMMQRHFPIIDTYDVYILAKGILISVINVIISRLDKLSSLWEADALISSVINLTKLTIKLSMAENVVAMKTSFLSI